MRVDENPLLPQDPANFSATISDILRSHATKLNQVSDSRLAAIDNALTTAPTTGQWAQGDFVRNSLPSELGAPGTKYVIYGFLCTVGGTPGTFVQCRFLTGN